MSVRGPLPFTTDGGHADLAQNPRSRCCSCIGPHSTQTRGLETSLAFPRGEI